MDLATVCLLALVGVLVLSCVTSVNIGLLAMGAAWLIGVYVAPQFGRTIGIKGVIDGFPTDLFLTLTGATLLFAAAQANGTLAMIVDRGVRLCRGQASLMPVAFFFLACGIAALGAGNIAAVALIAPSAMAIAHRLRIPPLLMTIVVAHGSIAGALTPISPIGIITANKLQLIGLSDIVWTVFAYNVAANFLVAAIGYVLCGGLHLGKKHADLPVAEHSTTPFTWRHLVTLLAIGTVFGFVILWKLHLGLASFTAAGVLFLTRTADERAVFRMVPWNVIIMVCGVSMLVSLAETTGALDLFAKLLARMATLQTINGWLALVTGGVSIFSSTSGVVLPTFIPMVPDIIREMGGGNPRHLATSIVIGSNLVDGSPLSTIGALCIAAAPPSTDLRRLFNRALLWGFAMAPLAAILCLVLL
ncbi:MAG: hypothetical protein K8T89_13860 [Planctomycetes bacterium]|nr:hypothetical protein [Planctomycetota bacterium]